MNWRSILIKGLPVVLIAAVIILIAVIAGRPKPQPKVSGENELVVDFKGLKITKASLYDMMKQNGGLSILLNNIDNSLLAGYKDKIDTAALDKEIADAKDTQDDEFYTNMTNLGIINGKDDPKAEENIRNYYMTKYLQKAYAKQVATDALKEEDVTKAMTNYKRDYCIIPLRYDVKTAADAEAEKLADMTAENALGEFKNVWTVQKPEDFENPELPDFLKATNWTCDYEIADYSSYTTANTELRDFIFSTTANGQPFNAGDFNATPKLIGTKYYIIYKLSIAPETSTYDQTMFRQYIVNQMLGTTVTDQYVQTQIKDLRAKNNLKIYDTTIATQYASTQTGFKVQKHLVDKKTVATYTGVDGNKVSITADQLYDFMKPQFAVQTILDKVNYAALKTLPNIQLTKKELASYTDQVKNLKTQFLSSGYGAYIPWEQYIAAYYGAFSESELADKFASQELSKRYLLGSNGYTGADPVTDEEVSDAYDNWFSIQASHIFFTFDPEGTNKDLDTKEEALEKANQVIYGCKAKTNTDGSVVKDADGNTVYVSNVAGSTSDCYIELNKEGFEGMENILASDYASSFSALAKAYSKDTGSASKGGDLGYFGPGDMVKPFEDAAVALAANGIGSFSTTPVESEVKTQTETLHGYHVIYITGKKTKTPKPENYDTVTDPATSTDTAVKNYYTFVQTIRTDLEGKHSKADNYAKYLAELRNTLGFSFKDADIQTHYEAVTAQQLAYDRTKDTNTPNQ